MKRLTRFSIPILSLALAAITLVYSGCSSKPNDNQLAANVQSKLGSDPALQGQPIAVAVKDGTVTLTGTANGQGSRELAANDAAAVKGVKNVVNDLGTPGNPGPVPAANSAAPENPGTAPAPPAGEPAPAASNAPAPPPAPQPIVIPAGTHIRVQLGQTLSTKSSETGQPFSGTLASPIQVDGETIIRSGAQARGVVTEAKKRGKIKGEGILALRLDSVQADGHNYAIQTSRLERVEKGKGKRTAVTTGGGAGLGAIIGGIAGGGKGAAIGALAGGGAGFAGGALTGNRDIELPAETILTFTLTKSVTITR